MTAHNAALPFPVPRAARLAAFVCCLGGLAAGCEGATAGGARDAGPKADDAAIAPDGSVNTPVDGAAPPAARPRLSVAHNTSCALLASGVRCWGSNEFGQFGDGSRDNDAHPTPAAASYEDAVSVSLSRWASHVIDAEGAVYAAGLDNHEQLPFESASPMKIAGVPAASLVTGSYRTSCLTSASEGEVFCRGENTYGEVGVGLDGDATSYLSTGLDGVTELRAGLDFYCAISGGDVYCWGNNEKGQLGTGDGGAGITRSTPTEVTLPAAAIALAAGSQHACAALSDGAVYCWGINWGGQAGPASDDAACGAHACVRAPSLALASGAEQVAASDGATCAIVTGGNVTCWGEGAIADGASSLDHVQELASGHEANHFCARSVTEAGEAFRCWGTSDAAGQLGRGNVTTGDARHTPAPVAFP